MLRQIAVAVTCLGSGLSALMTIGAMPSVAQYYTPRVEMATPASRVEQYSAPRVELFRANTVKLIDANEARDWARKSVSNIDDHINDQCRRSGGREYYCSNKSLTPAQLDVIKRITNTLMRQYNYYDGRGGGYEYR